MSATQTTNLGLNKPDRSDYVSVVNDLNDNMDIIDGAYGNLATGKVPSTRKVNGHALSSDVTVTKGDVGLGNVDNTSDANKPISNAQALVNTNTANQIIDLKSAISDETENLFFFNNTTPRTIGNQGTGFMAVNFPDNSTIECTTGETALTGTLYISSLMGTNVLKAGKTYVFNRRINYSSGLNYLVTRINASTLTDIGSITDGQIFTPSVDEKLKLSFFATKQNGSITFYIAENDKKNTIVPNLTATDYEARRMANDVESDLNNLNDSVGSISGNTENIFCFPRIDDRSLREGTLFVHYHNNSTIQIKSTQALQTDFNINCTNVELKAGVAYKLRIVVVDNTDLTFEISRWRTSTGAFVDPLNDNDVFTPTADGFVQVSFKSGHNQIGTVMFYIAEVENQHDDAVPNFVATDYIARRMANDLQPISITDGIIDYSNLITFGYNIYLNREYANIQNLNPSDAYCCAVVKCESGDKFRIVSYGQVSPRTWGFLNNNYKVLSADDPHSSMDDHTILSPITLTAPNDAKYLVVNCLYSTTGYTPKIIKLSKNELLNKLYEELGIIPKDRTWKSKVVAAYMSYIAILDNDKLRFSKDCGNSFNDGVSISGVDGIIKSYHFYNNGCLGFFTNQKAYYIESDWTTCNEAVCYEADGQTLFSPAPLENFYTINDYKERKVVNGQDFYVFGNYVVNGAPDTRKLIWASLDNGHTYKIIYEFGSGFDYNTRHVHCVVYYEPDDKYIVATGDGASESYVFSLAYENGAWPIEKLAGPSLNYKWANVEIYGNELFYSYDNTPGKIMKCNYEDIDNYSSHETVLDNIPNDAIDMRFGDRGDAIVMISYHRSGGSVPGAPPQIVCSRMVYYTPNRKDFFPIYIPPQIANGYTSFSGILPVTADGHLICGAHHSGTTNWNKLPSVYIDDYVRMSGFSQAFKSMWSV